MSYWKAIAAARAVPEPELREQLAEALYRIADIEDALGDDLSYVGQSFADAIQDLREEVREANAARDNAEERLEGRLQDPTRELEELRATITGLVVERDAALQRLAQVEPLIDSYSDLLATARRFVSTSEHAGVKTRHVRSVKGRGTR